MRVKRRLKCEGLREGAQAARPARPNDLFELVGFTFFFCNNSIKGWAGQAAKFILAATAPSRSARRGKCRNRRASRFRVDWAGPGEVGIADPDFAGG